jgi:pyruvate/2-oxoglutarate dehydrogenase complex dihydrolipoamide dehydrogenase (E3) component
MGTEQRVDVVVVGMGVGGEEVAGRLAQAGLSVVGIDHTLLGALSVAVHGGVPVSTLLSMIYAYPTFHRAIGDAVHALR